jgi:superfamily I DNA and RNA helicase
MLDIIFGENSGTVAARAILEALKAMHISGTLYLGYPVLSTADSKVLVDALLTSEQHGLVAFDLSSRLDGHPSEVQIANLAERQDQIHASLYNKLNTHRGLRKGRDLALPVNVITCHTALESQIIQGDVIAMPPSGLVAYISELEPITEDILIPLNAAIQRVSTLRPIKKRENVVKADSRGAILKKIEKEIANLDQWQNRGAIEYANGPWPAPGFEDTEIGVFIKPGGASWRDGSSHESSSLRRSS